MRKPANEPYRKDVFNVKIGNYVYPHCSGPCSSKYDYDFGDKVTMVTKDYIHTEDQSTYSRVKPYTDYNNSNYYLAAYTKK